MNSFHVIFPFISSLGTSFKQDKQDKIVYLSWRLLRFSFSLSLLEAVIRSVGDTLFAVSSLFMRYIFLSKAISPHISLMFIRRRVDGFVAQVSKHHVWSNIEADGHSWRSWRLQIVLFRPTLWDVLLFNSPTRNLSTTAPSWFRTLLSGRYISS